jgi:DNA-binding response OmpR family regulator
MSAHILVVEDDATTRMSIVAVLRGAGYAVTEAADGEEAIAMLQQAREAGRDYNVVLTDIRMHTVDGIEVMHAARSGPRPPEVIILTGFGTMDTSIAALRAGAYDYLTKPCKPNDLLTYVAGAYEHWQNELRRDDAIRTITQALGQLQPHAPPPSEDAPTTPLASLPPLPPGNTEDERYVRVGALTIDTFQHTMTFGGTALHLTPTEYELVYCLARAQGRVLEYLEIAQQTHGNVSDRNEAHGLLKTHIQNLRRKIDPDYIVSVRGVGYMLVPPTERSST